jgi:DnaA family protein
VGRDLGTLTSLLDRLDQASLAEQRRLTIPFLKSRL